MSKHSILCILFNSYYMHSCRDSKTDTVQFSGRAYTVSSTESLELFPQNPGSALNSLVLVIDPLKKTVTAVKNSFKPFW